VGVKVLREHEAWRSYSSFRGAYMEKKGTAFNNFSGRDSHLSLLPMR
jgi:hypothetical protein